MPILQGAIERKLSALLGAQVTFDKLNLSLFKGAIEVLGVRVGDIATVARVNIEVAIGRALKGEFVVKSLTIERPVVNLVRRADGSLNLPKRPPRAPPAAEAPPDIVKDEESGRWTFDAEKVLLVDGQINFTAGAYRASVEKLLAEMNRSGSGYAVTILAHSVGRRDEPMDLGELRGNGTITGADDLTALPIAGADVTLQLGDLLKAKLRTAEIGSLIFDVAIDGHVDVARVKKLLPAM